MARVGQDAILLVLYDQKSAESELQQIRTRCPELRVAEPVIQREGIDHLVVQLPGVTDPKRAIEVIGKTAGLEFKSSMEVYIVKEELAKS